MHIASFTPTEHWIYSPGNAGGVLFTLALHRLDLLRYLCGNIRRITAATCHSLHPNLHHDLEDQCTARLEFDSGATAELYVSYPPELAPPIESLILYDDAGHQLVSPPTPDDLPTADMFTNELLHFADCIRTGATPISSGRDALQSMQALFALAESARRQSQVDIAEFE